jgi:hypothetical protein
MAQMPRGEPRPVPDPDGDLYDEMLRKEALKQQIAEAHYSSDADYFSPSYRPGVSLPKSVPGTPSDALFCIDHNVISPAELASQRRAVERSLLMAELPLAGATGARQRGR